MARTVEFPGFVGGSYPSQSPNALNERTVNLYVEPLPSQAKARAMLCHTPGFEEFLSVSQGPIRGIYSLSDGEDHESSSPRVFFVAGYALYEAFADGTTTLRGTVEQDDNYVSWASNGNAGHQLMVISGRKANILDLDTNVFTADVITDVDVCCMIDGWFIVLDSQTSTIYVSELLNGLVFSGLRADTRSTASDRWRGMGVSHKQLWLLGAQTGDIYFNSGSNPMPFVPIQDQFFTVGIAAHQSVCTLGDTTELVWLGSTQDGRAKVYKSSGLNPQPISSLALDNEICNYTTISDAFAFSFTMSGHAFYALTFPSESVTWLYDNISGLWTEWLYWNQTDATYESCRVGCHAFGFGMNLVGDRSRGTIYNMHTDIYTDVDGGIIRRLRRTPNISGKGDRVTIHRLSLDMDVAVGQATGQGDDPYVLLRVSNDSGNTWTPEYPAALGRMGEYWVRPTWRQLGNGYNKMFELVIADNIPVHLSGAYLEMDGGLS